MNTNLHYVLAKIFVLIAVLLLMVLPLNHVSEIASGQGEGSGAITDYEITVHGWDLISINTSQFTDYIIDEYVKDVRETVDINGDKIVDGFEVRGFIQRLEFDLDKDYHDNENNPEYGSFVYIDNITGKYNRSHISFEQLEGPASSTAAVTFSVELFWDYKEINLNRESHAIRYVVGDIISQEQTFREFKIKLPDNWIYNKTLIPEDFPNLFFEKDTLMNLSYKQYNQLPFINQYLMDPGLRVELQKTSGNGQPPVNGDNGNDTVSDGTEDKGFKLTQMQMILIAAVIIIVIAGSAAAYRKFRK